MFLVLKEIIAERMKLQKCEDAWMNNVSYNHFNSTPIYIQQISELQNTKQSLEQRVHVLEVCVYDNQLGALIQSRACPGGR